MATRAELSNNIIEEANIRNSTDALLDATIASHYSEF
jgi:hypothetical protein